MHKLCLCRGVFVGKGDARLPGGEEVQEVAVKLCQVRDTW